MTNNKLHLCFQDITAGLKDWRVWLLLSWYDISLRYRQSVVGPFWITLSLFIRILCIGLLYSFLLHADTSHYLPFLAIGMLVWSLISGIITEGSTALIQGAGYLRQTKMPYTTFIMRMVMRNIIIFVHNVFAVIPFLLYYHVNVNFNLFALLPGIVLIIISGYIFGFISAILGTRFQDIQQVITSLMQVAYFITPIMWIPSALPGKHHWVVTYNPFAQYIALIRNPLMGETISTNCLLMVGACMVAGSLLLLILLYRIRHRIIYWL